MSKLTIVDIKEVPEHMEQLAKWHHDEWAKYNPGQTFQDRLSDYKSYLNHHFLPTMIVGLVGNEVVGSACVQKHDMEIYQEYFPWLASVFVHPDYRGKGFATQLVNEVMKLTKEQGYPNMYLYTPDQQSLYAKLGWKIIHDLDYMGEEVSIMEWVS